MPKSAKSFRQNLRKSGVFFTPKKLAEYMRSFFPTEVDEIYDPTCGDGGLLAEFDGAKIVNRLNVAESYLDARSI